MSFVTNPFLTYYFNPLPPHGGRLHFLLQQSAIIAISIHSLRMEGDGGRENADTVRLGISIHSLRMEGDVTLMRRTVKYAISIHSLRMEGDNGIDTRNSGHCISIHSLRMEGDMIVHCTRKHTIHFNPLPPHGGRPETTVSDTQAVPFQSTPSAWRETLGMGGHCIHWTFQSTPSAWRETGINFFQIAIFLISIHSLRMEGDRHRL